MSGRIIVYEGRRSEQNRTPSMYVCYVYAWGMWIAWFMLFWGCWNGISEVYYII